MLLYYINNISKNPENKKNVYMKYMSYEIKNKFKINDRNIKCVLY